MSNDLEFKQLKKQIDQLQQKLNAKTETILKLGKDLDEAEKANQGLIARCETLERNLTRAEREVDKHKASEELLQTAYNTETKRLKDEVDVLKRDLFHLRLENNDLQAEKSDLQKDCKIFRQTIAKHEVERLTDTPTSSPIVSSKTDKVSHDQLVKYERLLAEYKQMQTDLHTVLGVKEELIIERDELVKKVDRLTTEMSFLLNGDPRRAAEDLDSLLAENRFLKAQQEESETIKATLAKYRAIAESFPNKLSSSSSRSPVTSLDEKNSVAVINMKQIRELLASQSIQLDDSDFRAITAILLDLCNDKQIALTHLRRANKILGNRLHEVEQKLFSSEQRLSRSSSPRISGESSMTEVLKIPAIPQT